MKKPRVNTFCLSWRNPDEVSGSFAISFAREQSHKRSQECRRNSPANSPTVCVAYIIDISHHPTSFCIVGKYTPTEMRNYLGIPKRETSPCEKKARISEV